jgi:hypothetical protein
LREDQYVVGDVNHKKQYSPFPDIYQPGTICVGVMTDKMVKPKAEEQASVSCALQPLDKNKLQGAKSG